MKDSLDLALSGASPGTLDRYEQALQQYLCYAGDPMSTVGALLEDAPEFVMGHALQAYMLLSAAEGSALPLVRAALQRARALPHDEREGAHLQAIDQWASGHLLAASRTLEDLSVACPHDVLALRMGHLNDYYSGSPRRLLGRIQRALAHWSKDRFGWHAVLAMLAFGLEENGHYAEAERHGREAVALQPLDAWARHAVIHVCEMQARREDGIAWMRTATGWQADSLMAVHNWWHLALQHLALGDTAAVLSMYDGPIRGGDVVRQFPMSDASALLWRLELQGVSVGERWAVLAQRWSHVAGESWNAFNDWHAVMAFVGAGRDDLLKTKLQAQAQGLVRGDDYSAALADVGIAVAQGFVAFGQQDWARAVGLLRVARERAQRFGGSHAQRDLIELTLIEAARRGGQATLAAALEAERIAQARLRRGR